MAVTSREHNDANVAGHGRRFYGWKLTDTAFKTIDAFLSTKFLGGKYAERRDKLTALGIAFCPSLEGEDRNLYKRRPLRFSGEGLLLAARKKFPFTSKNHGL